jgi:hypothetical protein
MNLAHSFASNRRQSNLSSTGRFEMDAASGDRLVPKNRRRPGLRMGGTKDWPACVWLGQIK